MKVQRNTNLEFTFQNDNENLCTPVRARRTDLRCVAKATTLNARQPSTEEHRKFVRVKAKDNSVTSIYYFKRKLFQPNIFLKRRTKK